MKVALVHDHLNQIGGAENVLKALHEIYPDAPIFTLIYDEQAMGDFCKDMTVVTSGIQRLPGGNRFFKWLLPLMPSAMERFDLTGFDVVLSSSSAFAKGVITRPEALHVCYCYTPTRYLWHDTHGYTQELPANKFLKRILLLVLTYLRVWDRAAADRVDQFIGISRHVQERIRKYYRRESEVIYPPVTFDTESPLPSEKIGNYFLIGGRFRPYKRFDLAIQALNKIGVPLKIFGQGEEEANLRKIAGPNIEFLGPISDAEKVELYKGAMAFLHPAEEDFGITCLEAMGHGRPVIAFGRGGAAETVRPGVTGEFFYEQTPEALQKVLQNFDPKKYNPHEIRQHATSFSKKVFQDKIKALIEKEYANHRGHYPQSSINF